MAKLTNQQYQTLRVMSLLGSCSTTEVCNMMHLCRKVIGDRIRSLRKLGLVDNQGYTYWVTKEGQKVLGNVSSTTGQSQTD